MNATRAKSAKSQRQILFILDEHDRHRELVLPHLTCEPIIFEPADIAVGVELSYAHDKCEQVVIGAHVLDNVGAIWWRKMLERTSAKAPAEELEQVYGDSSFADYASRSVRHHASALGAFFGEEVRWVSNPYSMSRADNKPWQLRVAHTLEMAIPRTLQTSSPERARLFVKDLGEECIVKSLSNRFPVTADGRELMFWSQRILYGQSIDLEGLHLGPAIFQQAIKGFDVRVTVVGDKVFAAKITVDDEKAGGLIRDWRATGQGFEGKPIIEPYTLPEALTEQCIKMLKKLDMLYGALDFVVDSKGVHWFLEVNPMGAWGFIEIDTGMPIGKAMAELLSRV